MKLVQLSKTYREYRKLVEQNLIGWAPSTQFQPWYFLPEDQVFRTDERWPRYDEGRAFIVFARRQDNDDCLGIRTLPDGTTDVALIEGWLHGGDGYQVVKSHSSLEDWYLGASQDAAEWQTTSNR